ncbi:MAG: hypothetical protein M1834_006512 [Cirrosporium novae-zelandiae]|nr:MAG: hypothetical protein M1834_006512 [Cirrosporium novae-zelandiae]
MATPLNIHQSSLLARSATEPPGVQAVIDTLHLQKHIEGGYFVETDRDTFTIPNPFFDDKPSVLATSTKQSPIRNASTSIFYFLTPASPIGHFHRNKGRTVHTLHHGRGRYVLIHADEVDGKKGVDARIETFIVGPDVTKGERLQWIVEGGKYKSSFLLPDDENGESQGLLISETVIPGFEYADHNFMIRPQLDELISPAHAEELSWLLPKFSEGENE